MFKIGFFIEYLIAGVFFVVPRVLLAYLNGSVSYCQIFNREIDTCIRKTYFWVHENLYCFLNTFGRFSKV